MEKKPWPYWLKGSLIFGVIFLPIFFVNEGTQWFLFPLALIWIPLGLHFVEMFIFPLVSNSDWTLGLLTDQERFMGLLLVFFIYLLLGAFIGWIVDGYVRHGDTIR